MQQMGMGWLPHVHAYAYALRVGGCARALARLRVRAHRTLYLVTLHAPQAEGEALLHGYCWLVGLGRNS